MKKILEVVSTFLCVGSLMYLAGTWIDDNVTIGYALVHNGTALLVSLASGLYLKKHRDDGQVR